MSDFLFAFPTPYIYPNGWASLSFMWIKKAVFLWNTNNFTTINYFDFWSKIYLILHPFPGNLTTHIQYGVLRIITVKLTCNLQIHNCSSCELKTPSLPPVQIGLNVTPPPFIGLDRVKTNLQLTDPQQHVCPSCGLKRLKL